MKIEKKCLLAVGFEPTPADADQKAQCAKRCLTICEYVSENSDLCEGGGYVRWTRTKVCTESSTVEVVVVIASLVFFAYLFILLSATADDFFCENIACIVEHHGISQNTAGVTLMAFGNGSPDIFSSIASVMSVKNPQAGLAIGGLLGGSIFVTTVVVGSVIIIKPFDAARAPAIRDIGFHLVALGMLIFVVLFDGEMYWWQPFSFLVLYAIYALTVVSEVFPNKAKAMKITTVQPAPTPATSIGWMAQTSATIPQINIESASIKSGSGKSLKSNVTIHSSTNSNLSDQYMDWPRRHLKTFGKHFNPFDMAEFRESKWFLKAYHLVKTPCKILLRISIPLASAPWYKPLVITHAFVSPLAFCFAFQLLEFQIASGVPGVWFFALVLSTILSILIIIFTKWNQEPKYYKQIAAYTGFIMSIAWIYTAAAEIVDVVMMFGSLFDISYQILGLTAVSWCNAIGDVIADIGSARHGFNQMAFSAALGGPLFNLLVGFGSTFLIPIIQGKTVTVSIDGVKVVMLAGLATSLLSTLLLLFAQKFRPRWPHGVLLYVLYVVFLIFALLANQHVI
ncbi:sodium/calcium exchanger protein domain-containing protein [Ditylenchus destructor]|uniref:Sodium/calcium exchanger protein domain-containing protein n=1 Tax=Ditylenchus destructor TaxID=166010 RepID=A0AAD4QUX7_9BILA|nr:sodium/calcium exchanger protein domain-containing protein [Ditylenchus destructor]